MKISKNPLFHQQKERKQLKFKFESLNFQKFCALKVIQRKFNETNDSENMIIMLIKL